MACIKPKFPFEGALENRAQNQDSSEFEQFLCKPDWIVQFQPIFSFFTGEVYGYRVIYDVQSSDHKLTLPGLFQYAVATGTMTYLQHTLLEQILDGWKQLNTSSTLFFPVRMNVVDASVLTIMLIKTLLQKVELPPRQVVLDIMDIETYQDYSFINEEVRQLRKNGYMLAIGSIGSKYLWIESILLFCPDYVYLDSTLIQNIYKSDIQVKMLEIVLDLAQKQHFQVIANGIESIDDLQTLLRIGVQFGQGSLLQQTGPMMEGCLNGTSLIQEWLSHQGTLKQGQDLESITKPVVTFAKQMPVSEVAKYFNEFEMEPGIVVVQNEVPIGLVMREKLFQRLAFKYGYSLYWNREITNLMDKHLLILESNIPLDVASRLAMSRQRDQVYDLVIVTRRGKLMGAVAIKDILNAMTQEQVELARDANPLTGLPGNRRIDREISQLIETEQKFTLIHADLDHFKWFNDQYGFQRGDLVIAFTANVLRDCLKKFGKQRDFVGHIGGDDFILISTSLDVSVLCEAIISQFDHGIQQLYSHTDRNPEKYRVTDRTGHPVGSNGVSISLSVLECHDVLRSEITLDLIAEEAGHLKKLAKNINGSVSVRGCLGKI